MVMLSRHALLPDATSNSNASLLPVTNPTRVLLFDHTATLGGGELALLALVRNLDRARYMPVVLLCAEGPLNTLLREAGVETHILPLTKSVLHTHKEMLTGSSLLRLKDGVRMLAYIRCLVRFIKFLNISLVHTNSLKADVIGGIAARMAGKPVLWHIRDRIDTDYLPRPAVILFRWLCRTIPHYVVANSQATLETLRLGANKPHEVVYSGIEMQEYSACDVSVVQASPIATEELDSKPAKRRRIGLIGRISPWKGQHIFLTAAAQVRDCFPDVSFQIIGTPLHGEEAYEESLHALVSTLELQDCVEFLGFRRDIPALLAEMDILVHASTTGEPFGQVVVQGMAAGKPVIATNGGGIPEIVAHGETGLLVPMASVTALKEAMENLLSHPAEAKQMGQRGRKRVSQQFTILQTVRKVTAVYDTLLAKPAYVSKALPEFIIAPAVSDEATT